MKKLIIGSSTLLKMYCPECDDYCLVSEKNKICECGNDLGNEEINITQTIKLTTGKNKRKRQFKIKKNHLKDLIARQNNKCYWCGNEFGKLYLRKTKVCQLKIHKDHISPFSFSESNHLDNMALSCHLCNLWKSSKLFINHEDYREYLKAKWQKKLNSGKIEFI